MATLAAIVDENGIAAPAYADIFAALQESYRSIYGADINIDEDTQDGQFLALIALAIKDTNDLAVAVYNAFSPGTAVGAGLSSVIKVNGLKRHVASNSTVDLIFVGQAGTPIQNVIVGDNLSLGTRWIVFGPLTIPAEGEIPATATCMVQGNITASEHSITEILTPLPGLQTCDNPADAAPGAPVETDATLRRRQSVSTSLPAQTTREAIYAAVAELPGVQRVEVYQNDTNIETSDGIAPHNIAVVVEGGDSVAIATAIALKKPPGTPTQGTVIETVFDSKGMPDTIRFYPLSTIADSSLVFVKSLAGYVSSTTLAIKAAVAEYVNSLAIGEDAYHGRLFSPANLSGADAVYANDVTQQVLDTLSATYHVTATAQNRSDTVVTGGPYAAGVSTVAITDVNETLSIGDAVYMVLDDLSIFKAVLTASSLVSMSFLPAIPAGRTLPAGLIYVADDMTANFNEAFVATPDSVVVVVS